MSIRRLKWLILLIVAALSVVVIAQNTDPVQVRILVYQLNPPIAILVILAAGVGMAFGSLITTLLWKS